MSMSLFNKLSADCDFNSRVLSTLRESNRKNIDETKPKTMWQRTIFCVAHLCDTARSSAVS